MCQKGHSLRYLCQIQINKEMNDEEAVKTRTKTRRDRIKSHRAKRNRRRFYAIIDGKERARKSKVRSGPSKPITK